MMRLTKSITLGEDDCRLKKEFVFEFSDRKNINSNLIFNPV
jgi:hypothetical protein